MDYLAVISKNHVACVLGNHEQLNVQGDFRYVDNQNAVLSGDRFIVNGKKIDVSNLNAEDRAELPHPKRTSIFSETGPMGKIMRRRNLVHVFNNIVFSHAGLRQLDIERLHKITPKPENNPASVITSINSQVDSMWSNRDDVEMFLSAKGDGFLWHRDYCDFGSWNEAMKRTMPSLFLQNDIHINVLGHNKIIKGIPKLYEKPKGTTTGVGKELSPEGVLIQTTVETRVLVDVMSTDSPKTFTCVKIEMDGTDRFTKFALESYESCAENAKKYCTSDGKVLVERLTAVLTECVA